MATLNDVLKQYLSLLADTSWITCTQEHRISPVFSSKLATAAQDIKTAMDQSTGQQINMRPDVLRFAGRMAAVMDVKEEEKGPAEYPLTEVMMNLQKQYDSIMQGMQFREGNHFTVLNHLVHLANFCMMAHRLISQPNQGTPEVSNAS